MTRHAFAEADDIGGSTTGSIRDSAQIGARVASMSCQRFFTPRIVGTSKRCRFDIL